MSAIEQEVASQPAVWLEAGLLDTDGLLPPRGARVAAIGCGTSLYIAQAYAAAREAGGHGETDAFPASEIPAGRAYDAVLAISRSGTTTEVPAVEGRPPKTIDVERPGNASVRYCLDVWDQSGHSAVYSFLYEV